MKSARETTSVRPWTGMRPPRRILVIRFHAIGDVAITLPSCVGLRNRFRMARIDFVTGRESEPLPAALHLFDAVMAINVRGSRWSRLVRVLLLGIRLGFHRYDLVIDLQRNWMSRLLRRLSFPAAWSEFDRFAPRPGERVEETFHAAGVAGGAIPDLPIRSELIRRGRKLLEAKGWDGSERLILLNPAGLWETRNWPMANYTRFSRRWMDREPVRFVLLGTERIRRKAAQLEEVLGTSILNLVGGTSLDEALGVLQHCSLVLTEDSGLMHMAWTSGIPTLALFGSSRHDWSTPLGEHTRCLHSGDLPCGACMEPTCRFEDVHCLTRFSPDQVFEAAQTMIRGGAA